MALTPDAPRTRAYVCDIAAAAGRERLNLVSVVLFGSAASGGFDAASDLDLIVVVPDGTPERDRLRLRAAIDRVEVAHGFRREGDARVGGIEGFARRVTANVRSYFVCTRGDLLSGDPARLFGIPRAQAAFVDRAVLPCIIASAVTVQGEDLLPLVPLAPIRRLDVFKAFFNAWNQVLLSAAVFPFVPDATRYAMGALKRSLHNCWFVRHRRPAPLAQEVAFFRQRLGRARALERLLELRQRYRPSFGFILLALPTLVRLHLVTALDNSFPRDPRSQGRDSRASPP